MSLATSSRHRFRASDRLTPDQEQDLARRRAAGDASAINQLVTANLFLALKFAREWKGYRGDCTVEELESHAFLGLFNAARRYVANYPVANGSARFTTYAVASINKNILRGVLTETGLIRVPEDLQFAINREDRGKPLIGRDGRPHLAAQEGRVAQKCRAYGLGIVRGETEPQDLLETLVVPDTDEDSDGPDLTEPIAWLARNRPRHAEVIGLLYPLDPGQMPLDVVAIGRRLGVTHERIYQMRDQAFRWLRQRIERKRRP